MNEPPLIDARRAADLGRDKPGQIRRRTVHQGPVVDLSLDTVSFPDGSSGQLEIVRHSGAAAVLPILGRPDDDDPDILLIRQYRYAAGGDILEVPAGRPDDDEDWESCARRELEEETGLVAGNLHFLTTIYTTPGFTDERIHLFLATDTGPGQKDLDTDEFVELVPMPLSRAVELVRTGIIVDAKSIATILFAATFRLADAAP